MAEIQNVAFIGLGLMGGSFAANLIKSGMRVVGFDPSSTAAKTLQENGGTMADTPGAAAAEADLVIVMVPDTPQIEDVLSGQDGLFSTPGSGRRLMVMSTIDPGAVQDFAARAASEGWCYVDCPVGRTGDDARNGTSMFMLGGTEADKAAVGPVLDIIGTLTIDCGDVGHGMAIKITNNFLSTAGAVLTAEALRLAEHFGVTAEAALSVINETIASNGHAKIHFPNKVLAGDVSPGFAVKHARKDINIANAVMKREGFPSFSAPGILAAYDAALASGHGDNDWSDLYNVILEEKDSES